MSEPRATIPVPAHLRHHPDRRRWNARYRDAPPPDFEPHQLVAEATAAGFPAGPVLEFASGRSGSALTLAADGRDVLALDVSDIALTQLLAEAERRGLDGKITTAVVDVPSCRPGDGRFALVLATLYWDEDAFRAGCAAVMGGGLIGWEALVRRPGAEPGSVRPWEIEPGGLSVRLPSGFAVLDERTVGGDDRPSTRIVARKAIPAR